MKLVVKDDGQVALGKFSDWDVMLQYYDAGGAYAIKWLPYTSSSAPGTDQWIVDGIFLDEQTSKAEVFEPGVLNPGEEMVVLAQVSPSFGVGTNNLATVSSPNGVAVSMTFSN